MRYAIPVTELTKDNSGEITRLTQPVDVPEPPPWGLDAKGFLKQMFPELPPEGCEWVRVADDNVSGAVLQPDGSYENP